jgi:hypothetical protein
MRLSDRRAIVAIDPTTRGIAFISFEGGEVQDWGERLCARVGKCASAAVDRLLETCQPQVLILEDADAPGCRRRPRLRAVLRALAKQARARGCTVVAIGREDVKRAWIARGVSNKEAVAQVIACRFEELTASLPPRRKPGANEDPRANVFDAASLVLHYDARRNPLFVP